MKKKKDEKREMSLWLCGYVVYLLLVWGVFRWWVRLPEVIEELWFKPVIWLTPWFWWYWGKKGKPELFSGNKLKAIVWGLLAGGLYFLLVSLLRSDLKVSFSLNLIALGLVTAVVEELTLSGLFLGLWDEGWGKRMLHVWGVVLLSVGVHLPIVLFVYKWSGVDLLGQILLVGGVA